jgi:tRNA threonylcarbamoyladenosine biosynthesis protein TsaB
MQGQQAVEVTALIDARMDEMYAARYGYANNQWVTLQTSYLVRPEELQTTPIMAGNVFEAYGARIPMCAHEPHQRISAFPSAAALLRLAPQFLQAGLAVAAEHALPEYIRNKVAKTTEERVAEKAAFQSAQAESGV